jgi:hypothetical protein
LTWLIHEAHPAHLKESFAGKLTLTPLSSLRATALK